MMCYALQKFRFMWGNFWKQSQIRKKMRYAQDNGLPTIVGLEPISVCTFDCDFCMIRELKTYKFRKKNRMTAAEFEKIARNVSKFACSIEFSGGEPLLNEDIFDMFYICKKYAIHSLLASNASLLKYKENYKKLLDSPPEAILFSLEADNPENYANSRKNAKYNDIIEGLELFFAEKRLRKMREPIVTLQSVITKRNYMNIWKHAKFCRAFGADYVSFKSLGIWPEGSSAYEKNIVNNLLPDFSKCKIMRYYIENGEIAWEKMGFDCPGVRRHVLIGSGGEVYPCYYIVTKHPVFGNAIDDNFEEMWNRDENKEYLNKMLGGCILPECKKCLGRYRKGAFPRILLSLREGVALHDYFPTK